MLLPPSVPKGWPNSSAEALRKNPQRKVFLNSEGQQQNSFCGNAIKTSRYGFFFFELKDFFLLIIVFKYVFFLRNLEFPSNVPARRIQSQSKDR